MTIYNVRDERESRMTAKHLIRNHLNKTATGVARDPYKGRIYSLLSNTADDECYCKYRDRTVT